MNPIKRVLRDRAVDKASAGVKTENNVKVDKREAARARRERLEGGYDK